MAGQQCVEASLFQKVWRLDETRWGDLVSCTESTRPAKRKGTGLPGAHALTHGTSLTIYSASYPLLSVRKSERDGISLYLLSTRCFLFANVVYLPNGNCVRSVIIPILETRKLGSSRWNSFSGSQRQVVWILPRPAPCAWGHPLYGVSLAWLPLIHGDPRRGAGGESGRWVGRESTCLL